MADDGHVFSDVAGEAPIPVERARREYLDTHVGDMMAFAAVPAGRAAAASAGLVEKAAGSLLTRAMFGGNAARFAQSSSVGLARAAATRLASAEPKAVVDRSIRTFVAPDAAKRGAMALNVRSLGVSDAGASRTLRALREARVTLDRAAIAKKQAAKQPLTRAERSFFNHTYTAMPEYEARSVEQAVTKYIDARKALAANADTISAEGIRVMPGERLSGATADAAVAAAAKKARAARPGLEAAMNKAEKAMLARLDSAQLSDHRLDRGLMALGELSRRLARATPGSAAKAVVVWPWRASGGLAVSSAMKGYSVGSGLASSLVGHSPVATVPAGVAGGIVGGVLGAVPAAGVAGAGYGAYRRATRPAHQPLPKPVAPAQAAPARKPFDPYADPDLAKPKELTPEQIEYKRRRKMRLALERKYGKL